MIFLDLINLNKIRRALLYLLVIGVSMWLQNMLLCRLTILGARLFFLPAVVSAIGLWSGGVWGCILGLIAGLCCDLSTVDSTVTYLILFSVIGFVCGLLGEHVINRRFVSSLLLSALSLLLTALVQILPHWVFRGVPFGALAPLALLQCLWSFPFAVPAYFICKKISGRQRL